MEKILTPREYAVEVARVNGMTFDRVLKKLRDFDTVNVRALIVKSLRDDWKMSFREIGKLVRRDHSAVINLYRRGVRVGFKVPKKKLTPHKV